MARPVTESIVSSKSPQSQEAHVLKDVCTVDGRGAVGTLEAPYVLEKPDQGGSYEVVLQPGQAYIFSFAQADVETLVQQGDDLIVSLKDGSTIVLKNYAAYAASGSELAFSDALSVTELAAIIKIEEPAAGEEDQDASKDNNQEQPAQEDKTAQEDTDESVADELAQQDEKAEELAEAEPAAGEDAQALAQIEPAAGEEAGGAENSGFTFTNPESTAVGPLSAVGPIDPTALQYGVNFQQPELVLVADNGPDAAPPVTPVDSQPLAGPAGAGVDETGLDGGPQTVNGQLTVDFGADGPGGIAPSGDVDVSGSVAGGALTSGGSPVTVTPTADGYVGVDANGNTIFTLSIDPATGEYQFSLLGPLDHADGADANDVLTLEFGVVVSDADGDTVTTTISIDVADDGPSVTADTLNVDETGGPYIVRGELDVDFGEDGEGSVDFTGDYSVSGSVPAGGLTSGGQPVTIMQVEGGWVGKLPNGHTVFTFKMNTETGQYGYQQDLPFDHADGTDPNDVITLQFGVSVTDGDGDSADTTITVNVADDGPSVTADTLNVDETGGPYIVRGDLDVDFGTDGEGSMGLNGDYSVSGSVPAGGLTSGGQPVTITQVGDFGWVGKLPSGETVFTFKFNPATGEYGYQQDLPFDHADGTDPNDVITLTFGVSVTDGDGDSADTTITVNVADDGPSIGDEHVSVDETGGPYIVRGDLDVDFGTDGEGSVEFTGDYSVSGSVPAGGLTSGGQPVTIMQVDGGWIGKLPSGETVFTFKMNTETGQYGYQQDLPFDHADAADPNDVITLQFGVVVTDADGDTATSTITIDVADDGPSIGTDSVDVHENEGVVGYVPVDFGADGQGLMSMTGEYAVSGSVPAGGLTAGGYPVTIMQSPDGMIGVANGQVVFNLRLNPLSGQYGYKQLIAFDHADSADPNDVITLTFNVKVTDNDGDKAVGTIVVNVIDSAPTVTAEVLNVDETGGPYIVRGDLDVDFGADGAGSFGLNGRYDVSGSVPAGGLTSGGQPVTITQVGDFGWVGKLPSGETVFTFKFNPATGEYGYQQDLPFDHADLADPNDVITLQFGITVTDGDGDAAQTTVTVNVADDGATRLSGDEDSTSASDAFGAEAALVKSLAAAKAAGSLQSPGYAGTMTAAVLAAGLVQGLDAQDFEVLSAEKAVSEKSALAAQAVESAQSLFDALVYQGADLYEAQISEAVKAVKAEAFNMQNKAGFADVQLGVMHLTSAAQLDADLAAKLKANEDAAEPHPQPVHAEEALDLSHVLYADEFGAVEQVLTQAVLPAEPVGAEAPEGGVLEADFDAFDLSNVIDATGLFKGKVDALQAGIDAFLTDTAQDDVLYGKIEAAKAQGGDTLSAAPDHDTAALAYHGALDVSVSTELDQLAHKAASAVL